MLNLQLYSLWYMGMTTHVLFLVLALRARSSRFALTSRARPSRSALETCALASVLGCSHRIIVRKYLSTIVVRIVLDLA